MKSVDRVSPGSANSVRIMSLGPMWTSSRYSSHSFCTLLFRGTSISIFFLHLKHHSYDVGRRVFTAAKIF